MLEKHSGFVILFILILDQDGQNEITEGENKTIEHNWLAPSLRDFGMKGNLLQKWKWERGFVVDNVVGNLVELKLGKVDV